VSVVTAHRGVIGPAMSLGLRCGPPLRENLVSNKFCVESDWGFQQLSRAYNRLPIGSGESSEPVANRHRCSISGDACNKRSTSPTFDAGQPSSANSDLLIGQFRLRFGGVCQPRSSTKPESSATDGRLEALHAEVFDRSLRIVLERPRRQYSAPRQTPG